MEPNIKRNYTRETVVTIALVILIGGGIAFFLDFVTFGLFGYVYLAVAIFTLVGFLHYLTWGYAMSKQVAGEREEMLHREALAEQQEQDKLRRSVQDLSRQRGIKE